MVRKGAEATAMTTALRGLLRKVDSRTLQGSGQKLVSVHQEPSHTDVFRKETTTVSFLISSLS